MDNKEIDDESKIIEDVFQDYRTQRVELPEDIYQPLYDTVFVKKGETETRFFIIPYGVNIRDTGRIKTKLETNMDVGGVCPVKLWKLFGIQIKIVSQNRDILSWLQQNGCIHFRVVDKDILWMPCLEMERYTSRCSDKLEYDFGIPITINPYENFCIILRYKEPWPFEQESIFFSFPAIMRRPT